RPVVAILPPEFHNPLPRNAFHSVAATAGDLTSPPLPRPIRYYLCISTTTVDKSGERVQRMFGEIAPSYDRMNHLLSLNIDRYWRWWTVRKLRPVPGEPIL